MMRGGEALWRRRQPDHVLQGKHEVLSSVFSNSMAATVYRKRAISASHPRTRASCLDVSLSYTLTVSFSEDDCTS